MAHFAHHLHHQQQQQQQQQPQQQQSHFGIHLSHPPAPSSTPSISSHHHQAPLEPSSSAASSLPAAVDHDSFNPFHAPHGIDIDVGDVFGDGADIDFSPVIPASMQMQGIYGMPMIAGIPQHGPEPESLPQAKEGDTGGRRSPDAMKRKVQNRNAQRAFRQRKEQHVKDLETENEKLTAEKQQLEQLVKKLRENAEHQAEERQRALTAASAANSTPLRGRMGTDAAAATVMYDPTPAYAAPSAEAESAVQCDEHIKNYHKDDCDSSANGQTSCPSLVYSQSSATVATTSSIASSNIPQVSSFPNTNSQSHSAEDKFFDIIEARHGRVERSSRITWDTHGRRMLSTAAAWSFITTHQLFRQGRVDIGLVSEYLEGLEVCDGTGPVFAEVDLVMAIQRAFASGDDSL